MKDYKKYWLESVSLVLPIRIEKFDYTIDRICVNCPTCHIEVADLRGRVYEAFDCVEADIVGVCVGCHFVVGHRSRYYPESGRCLVLGIDGWVEGTMVPRWCSLLLDFCRGVVEKIKNIGKFFKKRGKLG